MRCLGRLPRSFRENIAGLCRRADTEILCGVNRELTAQGLSLTLSQSVDRRRNPVMTIKLRLLVALGILSCMLLLLTGASWLLLRDASVSMSSVFDDRIVPFSDLKV